MDKTNFKTIHRLILDCKKEVKSTQKQPNCEKVVCGLRKPGCRKPAPFFHSLAVFE